MNSDSIMDSTPAIKETLTACDKAIRELTAQRDELLACLKEILRQDSEHGCWDVGASFDNQVAHALIAKIEARDSIPDETELKLAQYREYDRQAKIAAETHRQRVGPMDFRGRDD
jgi:hypothetical protein